MYLYIIKKFNDITLNLFLGKYSNLKLKILKKLDIQRQTLKYNRSLNIN